MPYGRCNTKGLSLSRRHTGWSALSPLGAMLLYFELTSGTPGRDAHRRFSVARCTTCAKPPRQQYDGMPEHLQAGLTQYMLNNFTKNAPSYCVTKDGVSAPLQRPKAEKITGHQLVRRSRGRIIAETNTELDCFTVCSFSSGFLGLFFHGSSRCVRFGFDVVSAGLRTTSTPIRVPISTTQCSCLAPAVFVRPLQDLWAGF